MDDRTHLSVKIRKYGELQYELPFLSRISDRNNTSKLGKIWATAHNICIF